MNNLNDPLAVLFSDDAKEIDRGQLASLVEPFIKIDEKSHEFSFLPEFYEIKGNSRKIEIILAGAKARSLYLDKDNGLTPLEIINIAVKPEGSVKSSVKKLFKDGKIKKDKNNRYFIPSYQIPQLVKQLK